MRPTLVIRKGAPHWHLSTRRVPRGPRLATISIRRFQVQVVWAPWKGATVYRILKAGKTVWEFPNFAWVGDVQEMKKKKPVGAVADALHLAAMESDLLSKHQALVAHCAATKYDDGDPRKPGWWTIKTMGSAWVCEVKDPDTAARLVVVQQTLDDALTLANLLLESEEAPWEPDPWLARANAEKKKK